MTDGGRAEAFFSDRLPRWSTGGSRKSMIATNNAPSKRPCQEQLPSLTD
ncbi:hypothetical protein [Paenibacillus sp. YYML68]|nr:hypothetical protein [Paenibacillus sp. YYML68]